MSKINKLSVENGDELLCRPVRIYVCKCKQCRFVKNKRKNRKRKITEKRALNKKRRKQVDSSIIFYWA